MNRNDKLSSIQSLRYTAFKFWYLVLAAALLITGATFFLLESKNKNLLSQAEKNLSYEEAKLFEDTHAPVKLDPQVQNLTASIKTQTDAVTTFEKKQLNRAYTVLATSQVQARQDLTFNWIFENQEIDETAAKNLQQLLITNYVDRVNTSADKRLANQLTYDENDIFKYLIKAESTSPGTLTLTALAKDEADAKILLNNASYIININPITSYGRQTAHALSPGEAVMTRGNFLDLESIRQPDSAALAKMQEPIQAVKQQYIEKVGEFYRADTVSQVISRSKILIFSVIASLFVCAALVLILDKRRKQIAGTFDLPADLRPAYWFSTGAQSNHKLKRWLAADSKLSYTPEKAAALFVQAVDARSEVSVISLTHQLDLKQFLSAAAAEMPVHSASPKIDLRKFRPDQTEWFAHTRPDMILLIQQGKTTQEELAQAMHLIEFSGKKIVGIVLMA